MLFNYRAIDRHNTSRDGVVEATNIDSAISRVQKEGYTIVSIAPVDKKGTIFNIKVHWFDRISTKDVVILSRQISTLFQAKVSALRIFGLLAAEMENPQLQTVLTEVSDDLQGGSSISRALGAHPDVFSSFYVNMIRSGEESGSLEKSFSYLADYLDRQYLILTKVKGALMYPIFVVVTFIIIMGLMLTLVIPRVTQILTDSGQTLPIYTKIVIGISNILTQYIGLIFIFIAGGGFLLWKFVQTEVGQRFVDELKVSAPLIGNLNTKLYLTRICDNLSTMLTSGISMVQALEVTADVVDNKVYKEILNYTLLEVKGGRSFADTISEFPEIPSVMAQMSKVGEETGNLGDILSTLSMFYKRELDNSVDMIISLIEPAMIVMLGLGVGVLMASVLMPIYNIANTI